MSPDPAAGLERFRARAAAILDDLGALVRLESPSDDPEGVSAAAAWLRARLAAAGVQAETRACPPRGDALLAWTGRGSGGTLLLGHHDTVWPVGTLAQIPFAVSGDRVTGPGCFDMKAGLAVAVAVLEALATEPAAPRVTLLSVPDEEVGSAASRELLLEVAHASDRVLVLEPSADGAVKIARKGVGQFELWFRGRASHAGLDPEAGASALAELARAALHAESLGDPAAGTTVIPTLASAGSAANVVPEEARLVVDARAWTEAEGERVARALAAFAPRDTRVTVALLGGFDRPPLQQTPASEALFAAARERAAALGETLGSARVGGGSDGNFTAAAGIPTLDGLGPRGGGAHARDEWVQASDLPFRAALLHGLAGGSG